LLSHLHKDHAGGICFETPASFQLMFPRAKYFCQEKEMEYALSKKNSSSYEEAKLQFLKQSSNVVWQNGDNSLGDIDCEVSGAHTPFHQVFIISADGKKYFFGGDVLPQSTQLIRRFSAKYDYDGKLAAAKRVEYGKRAADENWICLFFHSAITPMATVEIDAGGKFRIEKV